MNGNGWFLAGVALAAISAGSAAQSQTTAPTQDAAVKGAMEATDRFTRAYGSGVLPRGVLLPTTANPAADGSNDLAAMIDQYDENASFAGTLQPFWLRGRVAIGDLWSRYFARYPDRRLILRDRDVRVFGTTSVENGYAEMYMGASPTTSVPTFMRYSMTRVLRDGQWVLVNMIVDRLPAEQPLPGTMPPWANTPPP